MKCFITGGAGFIGSHLVDRLLKEGNDVIVYDNLSLGKEQFFAHHRENKHFSFIKGDLLVPKDVEKAMKGSDIVFHLAANSDIIKSAKQTDIDLNQGTVATYNVLDAMRNTGVKKIVFTSSNVVYGEAKKFPIPEEYGPLLPISLYGASKLASEGLIAAFCHNFGLQAWVFRFANVIGSRATHGVVLDFYNKLKVNPSELEVLGDGKQAKPYIEVHDVVDGILFALKNSNDWVNIFNLGNEKMTPVSFIATEVLAALNSNARIRYTGGTRGWPGDVAKVSLDMSKLAKLGWKPKYDSDDAVKVGIKEIIAELNT